MTYQPSSCTFRSVSETSYKHASQQIDSTFEMAQHYSQQHNISMDDAMYKFIPDYDEVKWKAVRLEGHDSVVGDIITSDCISICCNSLVKNGLYNDSIALGMTCKTVAKYNNKNTKTMTHSGDEETDYGLRHTITFLSEEHLSEDHTFYIVSAPWKNSKSDLIHTLTSTEPILEIRSEDNQKVLKRFILPQDYSKSNESATACVNAEIKYIHSEKKWHVKICRDFIHGFADNTKMLYDDIENLGKIIEPGEPITEPSQKRKKTL